MGSLVTYPEEQKYAKKLAYEKEVMNGLLTASQSGLFLSKLSSINQQLVILGLSIWFEQSTRYTYRINDSDDPVNFQSKIKTDIKKARNSN